MTALDFLDEELRLLDARGLLRRTRVADPSLTVLCSNDYLGLAASTLPASPLGAGAGASGLIAGYQQAHADAERSLASWVGAEASLLFTSGFAANLGTISAIVGRGDLVISDELNHASIIDGCRLSGATVRVFPHRDLEQARRVAADARGGFRRALVVSESYFSMDGTRADLRGLRALADGAGALLMVDEAHALGVYGPQGRGLCAQEGVAPEVLVGTLGKAVGLQGAFVAGSERLRLFLWNRARSYVFSTAPSPALASVVPARVEQVRAADALRDRVLSMAERLRRALGEGGVATGGEGPIVTWTVGSPERALALQSRLYDRGVWVAAIRPPTVPAGTSRLRITPSAGLSDADLARITEILREVARSEADR